jgi:protein SMG6
VFDTNLLVSHLELLRQVLETGEWQVVVPLIGTFIFKTKLIPVINELDGLKVNPAPLGPAATEAVTFVEKSLLARKLRVVTQQGNGLSNLAFRSQQLLSKNTEDGAGSIDAFIIQTVKDQVERHTGKFPAAEKAVLVTGDRSMRVIAKARGVQALTAADLRNEISRKSDKPSHDQPRKRAWG